SSKPHVSDAIRQLRVWVTIGACLLALCCAAQMSVYAFAAYTDVRWEEIRTVKSDKTLKVVGTPAAEQVPAPAEADPTRIVGGIRGGTEPPKSIEVTRVHGSAEFWMSRVSGIAAAAGILASVCLAVLTMLGLVIAGGGCVPGVERVTRACVWSLVLSL